MTRDRLLPLLRTQGVQRLEALIITHPDADHFGNAAELLRLFPVRELWTTSCAQSEEKSGWQEALAEASRQNVAVRNVHRGLGLSESRLAQEKDWRLEILHPGTNGCAPDANTGSIVIRLVGPGGSMLLTGDLTESGEKELTHLELSSNHLKLGHHGSRSSSSLPFLKQVQPGNAWVSVGKNNRYRHPSPVVLQRLDGLKIPVMGTHEKGTLQIRFDRNGSKAMHYQGEWEDLP
jgi:competence protein ComEC